MPIKFPALLCALGIAGACLAADTKTDTTVVEEIVAKVNNEIVTRSELEKLRRQLEAEIVRQQVTPERAKKLLDDADTGLLRDRIDQLLLVAKGKELDIKVDPDLSKQMAQLQLKSGISDPDKFQQFVREQTGMSFEDYKQQMKDNLLTQEVVRREVGGRIAVPKEEQQKYYEEHKSEFVREEQVWLQEIMISTADKDEKGVAAAEKKANDLVTRARRGENFGTLAHDNSDAETAESNGGLPAFKHGVLKKEIEDVVFQQPKGYVTDPIRQPKGFLILKVVQHDAAGLQPFDAVENEIMDHMYSAKMQPAMRAYLTKLRREAFLQIREGYVDSGAAPGKDTTWQQAPKLKPQTVTKEEVAERTRRKRLMFLLPVPGTEKLVGISSSTTEKGPAPQPGGTGSK
jgi:parvulin-like peptidyl-prolyl isomerase